MGKFFKYLRKMGIKRSSSSANYWLQENLWFSWGGDSK